MTGSSLKAFIGKFSFHPEQDNWPKSMVVEEEGDLSSMTSGKKQ